MMPEAARAICAARCQYGGLATKLRRIARSAASRERDARGRFTPRPGEVIITPSMAPDWKRIRELFEQALGLEPDSRATFLEAACGRDAALRREVDALLAANDYPGPFLAAPAAPPAEIATSPPAGDLVIGAVVDGKYRVDALLGSGGMGAVYRATHVQLERAVALKVVRADRLADATAVERFRREAVAVARLSHPRIVTVHDYGIEPDSGAYLVLELLDGRSLRAELAERGRIAVADALDLMCQACSAVESAHRAGVIHRDLKPENIFLERPRGTDSARSAKVLDFGLAKMEAAVSARSLTQPGAVMGTPDYMSPEQCQGEEADARSDVYALGCVLYEMLTGRPPFVAPTALALVYKHVAEAPRRPSELVPEIAPSLDEAVLRALAKAPGERHRTAEAFAVALRAAATAVTPSGGAPAATRAGGSDAAATGEEDRTTGAREGARTGESPLTNLPHATTRFVGRERQVGEACGLLARARLVTLVGPGGIGKTRLAQEIAARVLHDFDDGAWLVQLASLTDPALVVNAVASALGVREQAGRSEVETLEVWLKERRVLLVLDNCEHLVDECARLAERLLVSSPGLRVLATSREVLGIAGEAVWPVPALALPEGGRGPDALDSEAVRLFVDRAALAKPSFEVIGPAAATVADLCRRLEGIPLAIELAAARVKALSVEQMLARLDDRFRLLAGGSRTAPARQQTLRATLDWSYELLTEEERALLRRLSVFAGGWTLDAAEGVIRNDERGTMNDERKKPGPVSDSDIHRSSVAGDPHLVHRSDVVDVLSRLLDKSLVLVHEQGAETRYGMLETVREYALERLRAEGEEEAARRCHSEFFLVLGETAAPELNWPKRAEWFERLEAEHDNVRAALGWFAKNDAEACLRLAAAVWGFWNVHGYMTEGRRWMGAALDAATEAPASVLPDALLKAGVLAQLQGDLAAARAYFARGMHVSKVAGDENHFAWFGVNLGYVAFIEHDMAVARASFEEGLAAAEALGDDRLTMNALNALGEIERMERQWSAARRLYERAGEIARRFGEQSAISMHLCNLGAVTCAEGDLPAASSYFRQALALDHELGFRPNIGHSLDGLAAVAVRHGAWERAGRLAGAAQALWDAIGYELEPADLAFHDTYLAEARERFDQVGFEAALAEGRAMTLEQSVEYALRV
jgi:predicted ATPase/tRNA A-37 threonylcarbamoyl transferase component Bud32/Tfp pilus assembly protein PilF